MACLDIKDALGREADRIKIQINTFPADQWHPILRVRTTDNQNYVFLLEYSNDEEKYNSFRGIGNYCKEEQLDVDIVFFSSEAWAKRFDKGESLENIKKPSEYADRKEIVAVVASNNIDTIMMTTDIYRDIDNNINVDDFSEAFNCESYLLELFFEEYNSNDINLFA